MSDKLRGLVKPLEWEAKLNRTHLYDQWYSYTIVGVYNITDVRGAFEWYLKDNGRIARVATLDEAKSAAQADYEQRVISALNPATVTALLDHIEELERERENDMLRLAVAAVLEADNDFRSQLPKDWGGDPLSDELDGLRRIFNGAFSSRAMKSGGANE